MSKNGSRNGKWEKLAAYYQKISIWAFMIIVAGVGIGLIAYASTLQSDSSLRFVLSSLGSTSIAVALVRVLGEFIIKPQITEARMLPRILRIARAKEFILSLCPERHLEGEIEELFDRVFFKQMEKFYRGFIRFREAGKEKIRKE